MNIDARIDDQQLEMINSPLRMFFQKHYEFPLMCSMLKHQSVSLKQTTLLDAGCGNGHSTTLINKAFDPQALYAFDLLPVQVKLAQARNPKAHISVDDLRDMNYADATFDAVFTFGVYHHALPYTEALIETQRVLKPRGLLVGAEIKSAPDFDWATFERAIQKNGFQIMEQKTLYFGYFIAFLAQKL